MQAVNESPRFLQPHPASDQAAASVVASGAQTTIQLPRVQFPDDDTDGASHTYVDSWTDEPSAPVTTVYGEPPTLVRQQTFGRVRSAETLPQQSAKALTSVLMLLLCAVQITTPRIASVHLSLTLQL